MPVSLSYSFVECSWCSITVGYLGLAWVMLPIGEITAAVPQKASSADIANSAPTPQRLRSPCDEQGDDGLG